MRETGGSDPGSTSSPSAGDDPTSKVIVKGRVNMPIDARTGYALSDVEGLLWRIERAAKREPRNGDEVVPCAGTVADYARYARGCMTDAKRNGDVGDVEGIVERVESALELVEEIVAITPDIAGTFGAKCAKGELDALLARIGGIPHRAQAGHAVGLTA